MVLHAFISLKDRSKFVFEEKFKCEGIKCNFHTLASSHGKVAESQEITQMLGHSEKLAGLSDSGGDKTFQSTGRDGKISSSLSEAEIATTV